MNDPYNIIRYPLVTERSLMMIEKENKIIFIVDKASKKEDIKNAVEKIFNVKVLNVNTAIMPDGRKKAYLRLADDTPAKDIVTKMGLM